MARPPETSSAREAEMTPTTADADVPSQTLSAAEREERRVNLFIMERRFILAEAGSTLRESMGWEDVDDLRAIIVEREGRIVGLIPPRSGLWRESVSNANRLVDDFVEKRAVVCRDVDLLSVALARLKRHRAGAAIVFHGTNRPRAADVVGVITKRAIADAVIDNYED
jgi:CIC family chloride channel protein